MKQSTLTNKKAKKSLGGSLIRASFAVRTFICLMLFVLLGTGALAHPGSGIVVDKEGNVFFTDTGMGVWKIDTKGKLTYIPASRFHWMAIDEAGSFAGSFASSIALPSGTLPSIIGLRSST